MQKQRIAACTSKDFHSVTIMLLICLLDWLFIDWEYGINIKEWDRPASRTAIRERLNAFNNVNSSSNTISYQWCFMTTISDLIEINLDLGAKKIHNWITVSTHKQAKKGGNVPFYYSTNLVQQFCLSTPVGYHHRKG